MLKKTKYYRWRFNAETKARDVLAESFVTATAAYRSMEYTGEDGTQYRRPEYQGYLVDKGAYIMGHMTLRQPKIVIVE